MRRHVLGSLLAVVLVLIGAVGDVRAQTGCTALSPYPALEFACDQGWLEVSSFSTSPFWGRVLQVGNATGLFVLKDVEAWKTTESTKLTDWITELKDGTLAPGVLTGANKLMDAYQEDKDFVVYQDGSYTTDALNIRESLASALGTGSEEGTPLSYWASAADGWPAQSAIGYKNPFLGQALWIAPKAGWTRGTTATLSVPQSNFGDSSQRSGYARLIREDGVVIWDVANYYIKNFTLYTDTYINGGVTYEYGINNKTLDLSYGYYLIYDGGELPKNFGLGVNPLYNGSVQSNSVALVDEMVYSDYQGAVETVAITGPATVDTIEDVVQSQVATGTASYVTESTTNIYYGSGYSAWTNDAVATVTGWTSVFSDMLTGVQGMPAAVVDALEDQFTTWLTPQTTLSTRWGALETELADKFPLTIGTSIETLYSDLFTATPAVLTLTVPYIEKQGAGLAVETLEWDIDSAGATILKPLSAIFAYLLLAAYAIRLARRIVGGGD